jgi:hypothetical protein
MIIKIRIGCWRFTWTFAPVTDIIGVNSTLPEGDHITMWDFDDIPLNDVIYELAGVKLFYHLSNIYIFETGKPNHFIAYCFTAMPWRNSVQIVACTKGVDPSFFKYGVYREHWTLRVTPKEGRKPKLVKILYSKIEEDCSIDELNSWVQGTLSMQRGNFPFSLHIPSAHYKLTTCPPKI